MTPTPPAEHPERSDPHPTGAVPLAQRLVRALCFAGLAIGLGSALKTLQPFLFLMWGGRTSLRSFSRFDAAYQWIALNAVALTLAADVLLLAGLAGELLGKRWSRRMLTAYACVFAASCGLGLAWQLSYQRYLSTHLSRSEFRPWDLLLGAAASLMTEMAYPVLLVVCLRWPETRRASSPGRAFSPVMPILSE